MCGPRRHRHEWLHRVGSRRYIVGSRGYFGFLLEVWAARLDRHKNWFLRCRLYKLVVQFPSFLHHQLFPISQLDYHFPDPLRLGRVLRIRPRTLATQQVNTSWAFQTLRISLLPFLISYFSNFCYSHLCNTFQMCLDISNQMSLSILQG